MHLQFIRSPNLGLLHILELDQPNRYLWTVNSQCDVHKSPFSSSLAGVVGDLVSGEVDLGVAAIIQTSEKAEVIDFAAPYFDLSGISIALRKKVPIQSFFKFALVFTPGK